MKLSSFQEGMISSPNMLLLVFNHRVRNRNKHMPLSFINTNANDNNIKIYKSISVPPGMKHEIIYVSTIRKYRQIQQQHLVTNNNNSISSKNKK